MKKILIIIGIILFVLGPIYLYIFDKLTNHEDLIKLVMDGCIFMLLTYLWFSGVLMKHKNQILTVFKSSVLIYLFCISGYSILKSVIENDNFVIEYVSFLNRTDGFILFFLAHFIVIIVIKQFYSDNNSKTIKS